MALEPVVLNLGSGGDSIGTDKISGTNYEVVKQAFGDVGSLEVVSASNPLPVTDAAAEAALASIAAEDFATAANQVTEISALAAILAKLSNDPATQTTLAAILAKIIAAPATEAKQDTGNTSLASIDSKLTNPLPVSGTVTTTPSGTQDENLKQVNGASVNVGAGASSTGTQRVITATDSVIGTVAAVTAITNALPAGNNNIGDVDIASGTITSITNNVNVVDVAPTTIFNGKTTVATAGVRTTLAASQAVQSVTIKALSTNTGLIYVGNASVSSTNGFQLSAGDSISMDLANLNTINIDCSVSGEGVTYFGVN